MKPTRSGGREVSPRLCGGGFLTCDARFGNKFNSHFRILGAFREEAFSLSPLVELPVILTTESLVPPLQNEHVLELLQFSLLQIKVDMSEQFSQSAWRQAK